jgi:hypothetical protein
MTCILVLGVPRSGTSTIAGVLHHLGVFMGERFPQPSPMNPRGFFEDQEVIELHRRFLDHGAFPETVILTDDADKLAAYETFIRSREAMGRTWGFKDRYTPFLFHLARRFIQQPLRVIVTERPFHESVHSWAAQRQCHIKEAQKVIADTLYARDLALSEFEGPVLRLRYHTLVEQPEFAVFQIARFVDLIDPYKMADAKDFIDPTLRRHR